MSRRAFNLHATERHATDVTITAAVWVVRAYMLTRHAVRDLARRWER